VTEPDLSVVRKRFQSLIRTTDGRPCVFADAPGGTQVPDTVIQAMAGYLRRSNANTGGAFDTSRETDRVIAEGRQAAADLLGGAPGEIVFGPNTTTLAFALSRSIGRQLSLGDEIVLTVLDHDANIAPWLSVADETGADVRWVGIREEDCTLDLAGLEACLGPRTKIVAFTLASNAVGSVSPSAEIVRMVRASSARDAILVADGVHLAPHRAIDVATLGADVVFCSAYKFFGPHLGIMWGRHDRLEEWRPYKVRPASDEAPDRWETGTLSHEAIAGLGAAIGYLADLGRTLGGAPPGSVTRGSLVAGLDAIRAYERTLSERFLRGMSELPHARLYGIGEPEHADRRTPTFALRLEGLSPREVATELGRRGIFVWDGNYYALAIMERLGLEETGGCVRIGFCHYNTADEVDRVLDELAGLRG
jgi:cysteine desulfurase family protein (TIGR01976 family)